MVKNIKSNKRQIKHLSNNDNDISQRKKENAKFRKLKFLKIWTDPD